MDIFLLLTGGILAGDGLSTSPALRRRENKITGLLDLFEHVNSVPLSFKLGLSGRRPQIDVLVLQRRHVMNLVMRHVLLGRLG